MSPRYVMLAGTRLLRRIKSEVDFRFRSGLENRVHCDLLRFRLTKL